MGSAPKWRTLMRACQNTVAATPLSGAATQPTPSTIQPIVVQLSVQDRPSVSGPPLISIPSAAPTAGPLINLSLAATQLAADDHDDQSEGRDLASVEELSEAPGDPQLEKQMMTEEEQRYFETFTLVSPNARRGKTSWKASQENTKFYSQA